MHGKCDCRTVILTMIFYLSLISKSSVTGLGVHSRWWMYDNITLHSLCYLARVRPVVFIINTVRPSDVHRCLGTGSWPLHVMACRLFRPSHSLNLHRLNYRHVSNAMSQWNVKLYKTLFNEDSIHNTISNKLICHPGFTVLIICVIPLKNCYR